MNNQKSLFIFSSARILKKIFFPNFLKSHLRSRSTGMLLMLFTVMAYSSNAASFILTMQQPSAEFGTLAPPGQTAYPGSPLNIAANPNTGYRLKQWTATPSDKATFGDPTNRVTTITLTGDVTVSAEFEKVFTLTMTYTPTSPAGGSVTPITGPVIPNTPVAITATVAGGYIFKGWTASPSGNATIAAPNNPATTVSLSGNATVNANFVKGGSITPAISPAGWGTVTPGAVTTVELNTPYTIKATPTGSGHAFANWTAVTQFPTDKVTFANPNSAETTVTITGNATIYANFSGSYTLPLENLTGLDPNRYTVYVLGYSVASRQMLTVAGSDKKGSFTKYTPPPANTSTYIPSFKVGTEITSIAVTNSTADPNVVPLDGARIYFFVADSKATYDDNNGTNGGPQFKILSDGGIQQCGNPPQTKFPIFNYVELTFLAGKDMFIDVSSVDGFFFPVTITATDNAGIVNLGQLGQPLTDGMTGNNIVATYKPFMDNLTAGGEDASAYLDLYTDPREASFKGLLNPGLYLQTNSSMGSSLHTAFDEALDKIFTNSTFVSNISLWQNWSVGTTNYDDVFTAEIVTATFPGTTNTHSALKMKGKNDVYTIFNPVGFSVVNYKSLDGKYHTITGTITSNVLKFDTPIPSSTSLLQVGMYVSSGGGSTDGTTKITAINKTGDNIISVNLNSSNDYSSSFQYMFSKAPTYYYYSSGCMVFSGNGLMADGAVRSDTKGSYKEVVIKGLENQIVTALNRGVGVLDSGTDPKHTTIYWATETNWYPKNQPQNFFSLFMHTAKYGDEHIFTLPADPATSARGDIMAMSYGFSYDENPMGGVEGPQVPSEFRPPFPDGTTNLKITLGSWPAANGDATLTMGINNVLGGTVSPDVGDHTYQYVASVPVTATFNTGYQFGRWNVSGSTTVDKPGSATGSIVTVTGATAVATANFAKTIDISSISGGGKTSITDLADSKGGMKNLLVFNVTTEKNFKLTTSGGTGDCDIYIKQGMAPNLSDYYKKSTLDGSSEFLKTDNPQAGNWFVLLYSASDYASVKLDIEVENTVPDKSVLTASIAGTKVNLEWTATGTSYDVYRSETDITSTATIVKEDTTLLSYQEDCTGTYYYYWVVAKVVDPIDHGKFLKSDFSNIGHPHGPDVITKILTNGVPVSGIAGAAYTTKTYQITVPAGQALLEIKAYGGAGSYDIDTVIDGSTKKYRSLIDSMLEIIRIENPEAGSYLIHIYGKTAYSSVAIVAKYYGSAPLPVTGLNAGKGGFSDRIILNWTDSQGATFYEIWRSENSLIKNAVKIGNVPDNSYEDNTGLKQDIVYYYWIKAGNSKGIAKESASASGYLLRKPTALPSLVAGNKLRFDKITLTWQKYAGATSYILYRNSVNSSATATILAEVNDVNNQTTYTYDDMGDALALGTPYYYFMKAKNGSGTGGFSLVSIGMLKNNGPTTLSAGDGTYFGKIRVTWTGVPGATGYEVHRYTDAGLTQNENTFDAGNNLFYDDTTAEKSTTYYYRVRAKYKSVYMSLYSPMDSGFHNDNVASLPAPVIRNVSRGDYGYVKINWDQVTLAENYKIYRNTANVFITSTLIATPTSITYNDLASTPDTVYWYWVKANNDAADATSVPSASMSGFAKSASTVIADSETVNTAGTKGSFKFYSIEVPADTTRLVVSLTGTTLTNNCDLYVKLSSYPTLSSYYARGTATPNGETLTVTNPAQGIWYILLYGSTAYANVTLSAQCYSVSDIVLTEVPANNLTPPFTATFKGKVIDKSGKGIPGLSLKVRNPITGTTSWLLAKTDSNGLWIYTSTIDREGAHEFDFFFTTLPDLAKGTATHTVFTRKDSWEAEGLFDFSSYLPGLTSPLTPEETVNMQNYLNIRQGWDDAAIDTVSEDLWIEGTLGKTALDTSILSKLDDGLYLFFYAFDGAGCGNDLVASQELRPYPLIVHVSPDKKSTVLNNLNALGIVGDAQISDILAGKTGIVAFSALSNPGEDALAGIRDVSLIAREQLEAIANLAENNSSVSFVEDRKFGYVAAKIIKVKIDGGIREFNLAADCIAVDRQITAELNSMLAKYWRNYWSDKPGWNGGLALYVICPKGNFYASNNIPGGNENSHFRGASVTKSFTAAAIMLLHQEGLLNIDDLITAPIPGSAEPYVPDTADYNIPYKGRITIRMLLNHRAGVFDLANEEIPIGKPVPYAGQNYINYVKESPGGLEHTFTFDELVGVVSANALTYFEPDTAYHYSDTGYSMLGKIIERVSGASYSEFVRQNLLSPNHLEQTSFPRLGTDRSIPAPFETGYSYLSNTFSEVTLDNMSAHVAEGNVISTPSDLGNWMRRLIEAKAGLSADTVNQMTAGTGTAYGLGIFSVAGLGYGHNGAHNGYMTAAFCDPKQDVTVIISTSVINWDDLKSQMDVMYSAGRAAKNILGYSTTEPY